MKLKRILSMLIVVAMVLSSMGTVAFADETVAVTSTGNVAKVGNTEYATIDEAIAAWTNNTTLTLLSDVTLSDVIKLSSTEYHILDLGTYTMTAASGKDAIQYVINGRSSASYALDIKADATNPGGITATGKAVVSHIKPSSNPPSKDRPITRFYGGVFNASYVVKQGGTSSWGLLTSGYTGASAPYFQFYGGEYNGTIYTNRSQNQFYGGTFNGSMSMSVDSSAYTLIAGGTFKNLSNSMGSSLNSDKFVIGTAKGANDGSVCIDENGYYVVSTTTPANAEASVASNYNSNNYFYYSTVNTNGMYYEDVYDALEGNKTGTVTVFTDEIDLTDSSFAGTIVVPEGEEIKIIVAEGTTPAYTVTSAVEGAAPSVKYVDEATGKELEVNSDGSLEVKLAKVEGVTVDGVKVNAYINEESENSYNITLADGEAWTEATSAEITLPAVDGAADGDNTYVVHEHDGIDYIYVGKVEGENVTFTNNIGFSTFTVNAGGLQEALDTVSRDTVIYLEEGTAYDTLYIRPTKSNDTVMYCGSCEYTTSDAEEFKAHLGDGKWHTTPDYTTNLENITIVGAEGSTVAGLLATSGHMYGDVYDYVRDKDYDSGSAYYNTLNIKKLTFEGVSFTGQVNINTSDADSVYDGVKFDTCTFTTGGTASSNGAAIRYYNESNNGNVKNIEVTGCEFTNCYQGVYTHHINGVTVTDSTFDTTGHNAIALQSGSEAVNLGTVTISGNTFTNISDRIIRFNNVAEGSNITITNNTATNSGDENGEFIKATSLPDSVEITRTENTWNGYTDSELVFEDGILTTPTYVAKIGDKEYTTLEDAVSEAQSGDIILIVENGEYELPLFSNKELTFKGSDKEGVVINDAPDARTQGWNGSTFHFENLTAKGATENYHGLANGVVKVTYKDCNVNGLRFLYATDSVVFENCAFNANGVEHSFWTYGASNVEVINCTFSYTDRAVNCYSENGAEHELDISFDGCTFTYTGTDANHEGAVEINSGSVKNISLSMDNCKGTDDETIWFNSQWDSTQGANTVVEIDDKLVWPLVAEVNGVEYADILEALNAASSNGGNIVILKDIILSEPLTVVKDTKVTLDLAGFDITYNSTTQNEAMITNKGNLTINDSVGTGVINYNYTGDADSTYSKGNYTISNGGTLTINGGKITVANLRAHAKYPVDNNSTSGDAILVVNGGHLYNYNTAAIRQFCNSTEYKNSVTINGGLVEGYSAIWVQNPGEKTVNAALSITGGEVRTTAAAYVNGTSEIKDVASKIYCTTEGGSWDDESLISITGGIINENVYLAAEAPSDITVSEEICNGYVELPKAAKVGDTSYETLEEALAVLQEGDTLTLLSDVTISTPLTIVMNLTIDGNGHTLTYTGSNRAIEMSNNETDDYNVTIRNLKVECTSGYCERGINYNDNGTLTLENVTVCGENITYALNLPGKSDGAKVNITGSSLTGCIALNVWGENCVINATDSHFISVDTAEEEKYEAIKLNNDGSTSAEGSVITINGGSITALDENDEESYATGNYTLTGTITVSDTTEVIGKDYSAVAVIRYAGYEQFYSAMTLQNAFDKAKETNADKVVLIKNIELTETVTVSDDIILDLNGCTVTNSTTSAITVDGGELTLRDSGENGAVVAASTSSNNDDKAAILFTANGGKFVLEGGTLESSKYGIRSTKGASEIVIEGGTINADKDGAEDNGYGVIDFFGSVTMNGGTINSGCWGFAAYNEFTMNDGTINARIGYASSGTRDYTVAVINGGTINTTEYVGIYWPSAGSLTITGGSVTGSNAVYVKSGSVAITGGTFVANGDKVDYYYIDSGFVETGDALAIENVGGETGFEGITNVSVTGGTFISANASAVASYAATTKVEDAEIVTGFISGGTYSDNSAAAYVADGYALTENSDGTYGVVEKPDYVAYIGEVGYTDLQTAIDEAVDGAEIDIVDDFALDGQDANPYMKVVYNRESYAGIIIPDDKVVTIDLNGKTISYIDEYADCDNLMVLNLGNLTINDSVGGGKLTYKPVAGEKTYTYFYSTVFNCGTLTVNGGTIENTCETITDVSNAVDNHSRLSHEYNNDCILTVNGGTLIGAEYRAVRQYTHYYAGVKNRVTINDGTVMGGVYMQHGDSWYYTENANNNRANVDCYLIINGGTITTVKSSDGSDYGHIRMYLSNPDNNAFGIEINDGTIEVPVQIRVQKGYRYSEDGTATSGTLIYPEETGARTTEWIDANGGFITGGTFTNIGSEADATSDVASFLADGYALTENSDGTYGVVEKPSYVAKIGEVEYATLQAALDAVSDNDTITLLQDITIDEATRYNLNGWYEGVYYEGDKSFTIDLNGKTITNDSSVNDYLMLFKNVGEKANEITFKNGTVSAGSSAYSAICTSSTSTQQTTVNLEDVNVIGNNSNGAVVKVRGGTVLNVKDGTVITGNDNYVGIEAVGSTTVVNIYEGAKLYQNGTTSYLGSLAGVSYNATLNAYDGYGEGAKGGFIAMSSGGTVNVYGGEWIADKNNTGSDGNYSVLISDNNTNEEGYKGKSVVNVYGGTFAGKFYCAGQTAESVAEMVISGGTFTNDPSAYVADGYIATGENGAITSDKYQIFNKFDIKTVGIYNFPLTLTGEGENQKYRYPVALFGTISNLNYKEAGFIFEYEYDGEIYSSQFSETNAYSSLKVSDEVKEIWNLDDNYITPEWVDPENGKYFYGNMVNFGEKYKDSTLRYRPYAILLDGTYVYGRVRTIEKISNK